MPPFKYTAHDIHGDPQTGSIQAPDQAAATAQLKSKGLFPTDVTATDLNPPTIGRACTRGKGLNMEIPWPATLSTFHSKPLMVLTRQMATLIHAGLPLLRGLNILERQESTPALKRALREIANSIEGGSTFAQALAAHPRIFNPLYINMVKAGEAGGVLDVVLDRLATYMEKAQKVKNKVKSAMTYPLVVLLVASSIMIFMMGTIIPQFETIFSDLLDGRALPPLTRLVMGASDQVKHHWPVGLGILAALFGVHALCKQFRRGRILLDSLKLKFPLFGNLIRMSALAHLARTLGTLMDSGVPILNALTIVKETMNNEIVSQAVQDIYDNIEEGEPMTAPVEAHHIFPPIFVGMVEVGEETGELPAMLLKTAEMYEDEVDNVVAGLSSMIEPLLIVILAGVVGTLVIAMFLPMASMIGNLS
ncbi:MAG: type II secretion system F family protein [Pontiella sp.]